jgi:hypothetical protein
MKYKLNVCLPKKTRGKKFYSKFSLDTTIKILERKQLLSIYLK